MKIEFRSSQYVSEEFKYATLTKGLFRKRIAQVKCFTYDKWCYEVNSRSVGPWISFRLWLAERRVRRSMIKNPWQPLAKLPEAKLLTPGQK